MHMTQRDLTVIAFEHSIAPRKFIGRKAEIGKSRDRPIPLRSESVDTPEWSEIPQTAAR